MSLLEKYKEMSHLLGHKEWILLEDVCKEIDRLNQPTYGPMLEDDE